MQRQEAKQDDRSEFMDALRKGLLLGAAALVIVLPTLHYTRQKAHSQDAAATAVVTAPPIAKAKPGQAPAPAGHRRAVFGSETPSPDVRRTANWVADSRDNGRMSFAVVDKTNAKVFLFDPEAHLRAATPALLGSAKGDDTVPGIADKPLNQVLPEEKTTPAGRFVAEVGMSSTRGEDVVWVDYDAAVSMHRVLKVPERLKSLASPTVADNRMSFGCINLPDAFFEKSLRPAADKGLVIYVLPETRPLAQTFASFYDVDAPPKVAQN